MPALLMLVTAGKLRAQRSPIYTDLIIAGNKAWVLTKTGKLRVIDLQRMVVHDPSIPDNGSVVALTKDRQSNVVIGTRNKYIKVYDSASQSWKTMGKYNGNLYAITFDSRNDCYLITSNGLVNLYQHTIYWPDSTLNRTFSRIDIKVQLLSALYMDPQDDLWLGFDQGEWGGDLFVFDTHLKRFNLPRLTAYSLDPIRSICSGGSWTYVSTSAPDIFEETGFIAISSP
jgi:ligand-binding sensor domain-containing protein